MESENEKKTKKNKGLKRLVIVLLLILGWLGFLEYREVINGEKMSPLARMLFSNRGYAENIEIKTYYLTDAQVAEMFLHPDEEVTQLKERELENQKVNIVLRLKGVGGAWGTLLYSLNGHDWHSVAVYPSSLRLYNTFVIPTSRSFFIARDVLPPEIKVKWKNLYTK